MIPFRGQQCCTTRSAFPSGEFAVFYDWTSLLQKDEAGQRSQSEVKSFGAALDTMGVWYAHRLLTTFIMSKLPEGWPRTPESAHFFPANWLLGKGWPSFERAVSALHKQASISSWRRIVDTTVSRGYHGSYREAPLHPKSFAAEIALKAFTNGADCEVVAALYADTLIEVLSNATHLSFRNCKWTDEEAVKLAAVLPMATRLKSLSLSPHNSIGKRGLDAIAVAIRSGAVPALTSIDFGGDPGDVEDPRTLLRDACVERGNIYIY